MLKSERDKKICARYSAWDETGHVHCHECPLVIDSGVFLCKAIAHWDPHERDWVPDEIGVEG